MSVSRNTTQERFLRQITPNNALHPTCEDARGWAQTLGDMTWRVT